MSAPATVSILGVELHNLSRQELLERLTSGAMFTPNVDIVMKQLKDPVFRAEFHQAEFRICDSQILLWASRFLGTPLKEKISGSDFLYEFCAHHRENPALRMFFLGAAPGVAEIARQRINARLGCDFVVGSYSPPQGFESDPAECGRIIDQILRSGAGSLAVALGAPKQERWIIENRVHLPGVRVFMGVGATLDFEAGRIRRAPAWISNAGLEWAFRLMIEPRRLWRRYLVEDLPFVMLLVRERWFQRR